MSLRINYSGDGATLEIDSRNVIVRGREGHSHPGVEFFDLCPHIVEGTDSIDVYVDPNRGGLSLRVEQGGWIIVVGREISNSGPNPYIVTRLQREGSAREYMDPNGEWKPLKGWGNAPPDALRIPLPF